MSETPTHIVEEAPEAAPRRRFGALRDVFRMSGEKSQPR